MWMKINAKKLIAAVLSISIAVPLNFSVTFAEDFEGNESKYYQLCAANELDSDDKETCQEFNKYLVERGQKLEQTLEKAKRNSQKIEKSIEELKKTISDIDDEVEDINEEIAYFETDILKLQGEIYEKEELLKERLYINQAYLNSNKYADFIFSAGSFMDFIGRSYAIKEITQYENDVIKDIESKKNELDAQKSTLDVSKQNLEMKQAEQRQLQQELISQLEKENETISDTQEMISANQESVELINKNIEALNKATDESYVGGIINATPNTPQYERDENGNIIDVNNSDVGIAIANKALSRQGYMYVWGGGHSMSSIMDPNWTKFDCSGLVSWAHYQAGVNIGVQYTGSLVYMGKKVPNDRLQAGDIILFSDNGNISGVHHVGIYIGDNKMVHAPSTGKPVQVASLDNAYWQREWLMARRLF